METSTNCTSNPHKWGYLLLLPIPVVAGLVNLTVGLAATIYRKKLLRQSYVYICVMSTLLSNIMFICLQMWEEVAHYEVSDDVALQAPADSLQVLWSLCTSAWIALLSAVCGNLTVLIYVMMDSRSFQNSLRHPVVSSLKSKPACDLKATEMERKRYRALFLLTFIWLLPVALTVAAVATWNCASDCKCSLSALGEVCPKTKGCSMMWPPMKNSFMGVNVGIWFIEVAVLLTVSATRFGTAYRTTPGRAATSTTTALPFSSSGVKSSTKSNGTDKLSPADLTQVGSDDVFHSNKRRFPLTMNPRLKLVASLSALFIVCTVLIPIAFFIDISTNSTTPVLGLRFASAVSVHIYTLVCPLLLVRYMSGLKSALVSLGTAVNRCSK